MCSSTNYCPVRLIKHGYGNSLQDNIRKSDNRKLFKKQKHQILVNILKKENAFLTPSSILEIMKSF